jgi:predicted esterase
VAREVEDAAAAVDVRRRIVVAIGHSSGAVVTLEAVLAATPGIAGLVMHEPPLVFGDRAATEAACRPKVPVQLL